MINNLPYQGYTEASFRALTDAILPTTMSTGYGGVYSDLGVHGYLIYALNHYVSIQKQLFHKTIPLAYPTALLLDAAATQLVHTGKIQAPTQSVMTGGGMFSFLSKIDRIRVLSALENLDLDLYLLPGPFQNNAGLIKHVTDALNRFSMFGYYSEWPAYGTTRLYPPPFRRLEFFPPGWQQVGYPGVAYGYRDFRGFLLTMNGEEGDE